MDERVLVERSAKMMGTRVDVYVAVPLADKSGAETAADACLDWLREVERVLTRFDPQSELCQLNAAAGTWRTVSQLLFDAVEQSLIAAQATDGLFDPTLLPLLEALGYDRDFDAIVGDESGDSDETESAMPRAGMWHDCKVDRSRLCIRLPRGAKLDLGGIAKGWAADLALERYFSAFPNVIVNVGGDMRVRGGKQPGEPWALGIGDPREAPESDAPRHAIVLTLGQGGLATSGATTRWWRHGGRRQHHLIDPRTSQPAHIWIASSDDTTDDPPLLATATALAPTAAHAEVAAKVALLRSYPEALHTVAAAWDATANSTDIYGDANVALMLILGTGDVATSAHLQSYLTRLGGGGDVWVD